MNPPERIKKRKGPAPGTGGRPPFEMDWKTFDGLCQIQCTLEEISSILGCSEDTIERCCKKTHSVTFADYYAQKAAMGKASLRRAMHQSAVGHPEKKIPPNPTMMIWLSKNRLGMTDKIETKNETDIKATVTEWVAEFTPLKPKSDSKT